MFGWGNRYVGTLERKAILITGCDTGFGRLMALDYCRQGALVFAACLTEEHAETLKAESKGPGAITTFILDVTKEDQIQRAFEFVKDQLKGFPLYALINNAGIIAGWYVEMTQLSEYRRTMEINFFGHINVIKTFLPLIQNPGGRCISIVSYAGMYAAGGVSAYAASKFAVNGFLDSLRNELRHTGIKVIKIMPGGHKTPGATEYTDLLRAKERYVAAPKEVKSRYPRDLAEMHLVKSEKYSRKFGDPTNIIYAVKEAMLMKHPSLVYYVGKDAWFVGKIVSHLPTSWQDFLQASM